MIDNPILNRPYDEPVRALRVRRRRHHRRSRRAASPIVVLHPGTTDRKGGQQLELTELTADLVRRNDLVDRIRGHVGVWRGAGFPNVTPTSRALLEHWSDPQREGKVLFCQREAAETAIYLAEVAPRSGDVWIRNEIATANTYHNAYKRLKAALKADIDEDAWASVYRTASRPFPTPTSGRIAVKVINHYGDEVLKVFELDR